MPRPPVDGRVVRLTAERLRRLERRLDAVDLARRDVTARLDATAARLEEAIDVLTRLVRVVAVQHDRLKRTRIDRLTERVDRLGRSVITGRTGDSRRLAAAERRLAALERRLG